MGDFVCEYCHEKYEWIWESDLTDGNRRICLYCADQMNEQAALD